MTTEQLKQTAAAMIAFAEGKPVQFKYPSRYDVWTDTTMPEWLPATFIYRPKPEPVTRPWSKPEDVPGPVCWVKRGDNGWPCLITEIEETYIVIGSGVGLRIKWIDIDCDHRYSTDRKTWKPCTTEA